MPSAIDDRMTLVIYVIPPISEVQKAKRRARRRRIAAIHFFLINGFGLAIATVLILLILIGCQMPLR